MKPDNWNRFAAGLLTILLCLCSFSIPAFASGTDPAPEPLPAKTETRNVTRISSMKLTSFLLEVRQLL